MLSVIMLSAANKPIMLNVFMLSVVEPVTNAIKAFSLSWTLWPDKPERFTHRKKFSSWPNVIKSFYGGNFANVHNKLECFSMASLSNLV
jgi:hypothetical protein